jgi:hypothetical protein
MKSNLAGMVPLKIVSGDPDLHPRYGHLQQTYCSFNIGPYGKWFQRRYLNIFPIGSYVKTMSTDGGHLGWRFGSLDIILKVDHHWVVLY